MLPYIKKIILHMFFRKGIASKIMFGPLRGYKYLIKPDTGFSSILGNWEKESQIIYQNTIFKNDTIFDLGANFGIHSMLYSKLTGVGGQVISFEPLPENINDIKHHIRLNNITNIKVEEYGISNESNLIEFKLADHGSQGSLVGIGKENGRIIKIKTTTLDAYCIDNNIYPDFVKIDIEGAEAMALKGYDNAIAKSYPFLAIDLHNLECDLSCGEFLRKHNYIVYRINNKTSKKNGEKGFLLKHIKSLNKGYPEPDGIWGVIWAVHPTRYFKVKEFIKKNIESAN